MARFTLYLLGPPRIEREGVAVSLDTRKALALLAYLAGTRQFHSRDTLAGLLWPDYDQAHARATLRRTLSTLNKALPGAGVITDHDLIGLRPSADLAIDLDQFTAALAAVRHHPHPQPGVCPTCLATLATAVTCYQDDFLAGFSLRDSAPFEEWQLGQAETLRRELAGALEQLVQGHTTMGAFATALPYARRWLALDPLHEPAHRQVMLLYAWSGQRALALQQYRACVQVLDAELGVAPLTETTRLYEAIIENQPPQPPTPAAAAPAPVIPPTVPPPAAADAGPHRPMPARLPLVGRETEWATLTRTYDARGQDGHVFILEGEAGIGKTRLAEELLAHVRAGGTATLTARCYEGESTLAYGLIISLLRAVLALPGARERVARLPGPSLSEGARLLPDLNELAALPPASPLDSPGAQTRFFAGLHAILRAAGAPRLALLCDDIQWADPASVEVLAYAVRRLPEWPLTLVLTWRRPAGVAASLETMFSAAGRAGTATLLPLPRLNPDAVAALVREVAPRLPGAEGLADRLYQETEGLPFFLAEYLAAPALRAGAGAWAVPGGVRDLLHARLRGTSETGRQLLGAAAVLGRAFDFDTVREASGRGEDEAVTALEELLAQALVREGHEAGTGALRYDFAHEKLRALVYEETSLARRRLLHRRVADALAHRARHAREGDALAGQIASHYQQSGNEAAAAEYYRRAGEHARALYANRAALAHFRLALALGHPAPAALYEAVGDLHTLLGEYGLALTAYETAAAQGPPAVLARLEHKLGLVYQRRGDWDLAESHLTAALAALGAEDAPGAQARIYADWSLLTYQRDAARGLAAAQERARQALALAEAAGEPHALAQAHNMLGILAGKAGDAAAARQHLEASLALADRLGDPTHRAAALNNLALACAADGDPLRARTLAEAALALCVAQGDRPREAALHSNLADLLHAGGEAAAALAHLKQAVAIYAEIGVEAGDVQPAVWRLAEW